MARLYRPCKVICDPAQLVNWMQRLRRAGVHVEPYIFTQPSVGKLALGLLLAIRNRTVAIPNDPALLDELSNVRLHRERRPAFSAWTPPRRRGTTTVPSAWPSLSTTSSDGRPRGRFHRIREARHRRARRPRGRHDRWQRAIARTQRAIERAEQMAAKRQRPRSRALLLPETRPCRYCGEAAPEHTA